MNRDTKPIHGAPVPLWKRLGLEEFPPCACDFAVGDRVKFTNSYGAVFETVVVGFSKDTSFYGFIHLARHRDGNGDAWWFPHRESEIAHLD